MLSPQHRQAGFSLVELMVAMALSLVLFGGLLNAYVATVKHSSELITSAHLDNELHKLLDMMARDLRRTGSHGDPQSLITGAANPFGMGDNSAYTGEAAGSCMTFSYDWDSDGVMDTTPANADERYGYRLKSGVVQARVGGLGCDADGWTDITDGATYRVTALQFTPSSTAADDMRVREIAILLNAELINEPDINRSLSKTVRLRNDLYNP